MALSRLVKDIAHALVVTAHEEEIVGQIVADLSELHSVFIANPEILAALRERSAPIEKRSSALREALKKEVHTFVINALLNLQQANLLDEFNAFFTTVVKEAQEYADHYEIKVTSAIPLQAADKKGIESAVSKRFTGSHRFHENIDPKIIGGLILEIGDWRLDASVKGKIERLKATIINES